MLEFTRAPDRINIDQQIKHSLIKFIGKLLEYGI